MPPEQAADRRRAQDRRARSTSGPTRRSARSLGDDADDRPAAFRHRAGRQRAAGSAGRVHRQEPALHRAVDRRHRGAHRRDAGGRRRGARRVRAKLFAARASASAAASRRQGPHRVERPDDCRVRARGARAAPAVRPRRGISPPRRSAAAFIRRTLWSASRRRLLRRYRDGDAAIDGYAEDYAYLDLRAARAVPGRRRRRVARVGARRCRRVRTSCSGTTTDGGWFSTTGRDPTVLLRLKEDYDGAEPAASSVVGAEPAHARITCVGGGAWLAQGRAHAGALRSAHRRRRARRPDDARAGCRPGTPSTRRSSIVGDRRAPTRSRLQQRSSRASYRAVRGRRAGRAGARRRRLPRLLPFVGAMTLRDGARDGVRVPRFHLPRAGRHDAAALAAAAAELIASLYSGSIPTRVNDGTMLFNVEIVLRERDYAVTEQVHHTGNEPSDWTELDVEGVLKSMLLAIDRVEESGRRAEPRHVALARLQLDRRADRRRRRDRDRDPERRRRRRPVRDRAAQARSADHAGPRRRPRPEARRPLSAGAGSLSARLRNLVASCSSAAARRFARIFARSAPGIDACPSTG